MQIVRLINNVFLRNAVFSILCFFQGHVFAQAMTVQQILQRVIDHYPTIKTAAIQVEKARQENIKVESQLSWILNANAGYRRNTSLFGTPTDRFDVAGGLNRRLGNGDDLGLNVTLSREDASDTFGPTIPNPLSKNRFDVNYRHRFEKGHGNPLYEEGLASAKAGELLALGDKYTINDQLASQILTLYLGLATTQARISNINKTIKRTQRLKKYIQGEFKLGLSEEKDILQVDARLSINQADKKSLQVALQRQTIALNRLMGEVWDNPIITEVKNKRRFKLKFKPIYLESQTYSPALKRVEARLQLADSAIRSRRDEKKDALDLVMFLGNEYNQGDLSVGQLEESEIVGGIRVEFNRGLDKRGVDAQLRQAYYDRGMALQDKKQILEDLQYNILSLITEVKLSDEALSLFKKSVRAERKKLEDAKVRYRNGRIETDRLIDFESQLSVAELSLDLQKIALMQRHFQLMLVRGILWKNIKLPDFDVYGAAQNASNPHLQSID